MTIVGMSRIDRHWGIGLMAAVAVVMTVARPVDLATAWAKEPAAKPEDAAKDEDPAEVQRRQQIKQQATHWEQQLTKLLYGDLELIRSIAGDIPRDARKAIARDGEKAVKEAAVRLAELQFGGRKGRADRAGGGIVIREGGKLIANGLRIVVGQPAEEGGAVDDKKQDDPVSLLSETLAKSLATHVGSELATAFTRQLVERTERRKAATVHEIVAVLDGELFLTASQREQIERSLLEKWDEGMASSLEGTHWADDRRVFPGLPGDCISPHLTETQRKRFAPQGNGRGVVVAQRQAWNSRMNMLGNVQAAARDPWWFE